MTEPVTGMRPAKVVASRPVLFWGYVALCGLVGLAALVTAAAHLTTGQLWAMGSPFALIAGLVLLAELRPVVTAGAYDAQGVTISTAFVFAILFYWGPWPALLVHGLGVLLGELAKRKPLWKVVFNTGQYVACLSVAAAVLWLAGMRPSPDHPIGDISVHADAGDGPVLGRVLRGQPGAGRHRDHGLRRDGLVGRLRRRHRLLRRHHLRGARPVPGRRGRHRDVLGSDPAAPPPAVPRLQDGVHLAREGARCAARRPDRAREPQAPGSPDGAGRRGERTHRSGSRPVPARPRPLQGDQRHPRPPHRRPAARDRRRPAGPRRPARGHGRPARR